jgi:hypothetical protein
MLDVQKGLDRAANGLEHIACSLMAIEMMQAAQPDGSYGGLAGFLPSGSAQTRDSLDRLEKVATTRATMPAGSPTTFRSGESK